MAGRRELALIERIEECDAVLEQFLVALVKLPQSLDEGAEERGLGPSEARVLQVEIVHQLGDATEASVGDTEPRPQHLERATVALVREVPLEHVERDGVRLARGIRGRECEDGVRVDEAANQPGARHAIDAGPVTRQPAAALERGGIEGDVPVRCGH